MYTDLFSEFGERDIVPAYNSNNNNAHVAAVYTVLTSLTMYPQTLAEIVRTSNQRKRARATRDCTILIPISSYVVSQTNKTEIKIVPVPILTA